MSHCAPLPLQAVTITRLGDDAALVRLTGAPPVRSTTSLAVPGSGAAATLTWFQLVKFWLAKNFFGTLIPFDDPATFNGTVERFLRTPFVKRDRIGDAFKSFEKLRSLAAAPGH
jgi:hypothetical protein